MHCEWCTKQFIHVIEFSYAYVYVYIAMEVFLTGTRHLCTQLSYLYGNTLLKKSNYITNS